MRATPEFINSLQPHQIFVFGSNEAGRHGKGAALQAATYFGAKYGVGFGPSGMTFTIPTKDWNLKPLALGYVETYVHRFIDFAWNNPNKIFFVTKIGCGLAGYNPTDIAPLFFSFEQSLPENIFLPQEFLDLEK